MFTCIHAKQSSVLTVLFEDSGDGFIHMLLQFGTVEAEAALKGEQTNSLCYRANEPSTPAEAVGGN